ncbi:unnamed protein product [Parascedosporium putredinis]|uniref:LDB19 N-terminal domain-containing protein n=1 Tax=Parascedosporium putredinis TaxID=1442378 RepID=A0A9P1MD57_9PEZI|nr:unnamed protein product [Parascedosporium putredinis]CAI8002984.1 unnamed protein product [Parascedosporium putredinis]
MHNLLSVANIFRTRSEEGNPAKTPLRSTHEASLQFPLPFFSKSHEHPAPATLAFVVESPPVLFYLDPERSTGALVSGQVVIDVKEELLEVNSVAASVTKTVVHKKPFQSHCDDCTAHEEELQHWTLVAQPLLLSRGLHKFPFTGILEGHLPITTETNLVSISYELRATTLVSRHPVTPDGPGIPIFHSEPLQVRRSLPETDAPHNSQVLYPSGRNNLTMALDGLTTKLVQEDSRAPRFVCDTVTAQGTQISHSLLVELIVSRARAPASKPDALVDTGTGRILRMRFRVYLTDKPGSRVAWDDEAPPSHLRRAG